MKITLLTLGTNMSLWVQQGFEEYIKRLPHYIKFSLVEIPQKKYLSKISVAKIQDEDTQMLIEKIPHDSYVIGLDSKGEVFSTEVLAKKLEGFHQNIKHLVFMIGGPEGFSESIIKKTQEIWSFSKLTFPHPLVRVILAEQLYRGFSIMGGHPYHR